MKRHALLKDKPSGVYFGKIQVNGVLKKFWFNKNRRKLLGEFRQLENDLACGKKSFMALANPHIDKTVPGDIRISELVTLYLEWLEANRARGTFETCRYLLQPFVEFFGDCMISDLNTITLTRYYAYAKKNRGRGENGGNHHMRHVKTLIRWGEAMEICVNPIRRFPAIREAPAATKTFTDADIIKLMSPMPEDFRDVILFGLLTGLRPPELRGLCPGHILRVGDRWAVVLERHKTSKSAEIAQPRCVPLSPQAVAIYEKQMAAHPGSTHVFLNDHGKPYTAGGLRQRLQRACKTVGLDKRAPYALRHYFGTKRAASGDNQTLLAQLMGHTKLHTTARYISAVPEYYQRAMDEMGNALTELSKKVEENKTATEVVREWSALKIVK